jgi:pimeloyl-ACP methyl ester carboxylesterase
MKKTIVFIHGMFQNPKSWKNWTNFFEANGYECHAPAWPYHEGEPAYLRNNPPEGLGDLTLDDVVTSVETYIYNLPEKPIVIGHSVGGLIAQLLVNRDLVSAGIAISSVAPNAMVTFDWSFMKNSATIANPFKGDDPIYMDIETFRAAFANTLSPGDALDGFNQTATHDSRNVFRGCMGTAGQLNLDNPHVPLLLIGGEKDQICPPSLNEKNVKAYTDASSITEFVEFPNRSHFICNEPGWEEVASHIANWLKFLQIGAKEPVNTFYK